MWCDSRASFWPTTLQPFCLGREPKARVATLHATYTQGNSDNSQLLMVGSQIANLTADPSFGHNLCLKCSNGSCKPILDIYVPRSFWWYKELINTMGFDPCNFFLRIQESIGTSTPKVGAHLGVWRFIPAHSPTLQRAWNVNPRLSSWPTPLQALALVTRPRLGLRQLPSLGELNILIVFSKHQGYYHSLSSLNDLTKICLSGESIKACWSCDWRHAKRC
jgi:hypothetical protein